MIDWDNRVHQMDSSESKNIFYFFKYVKKNMILIAALDRQFSFYETELKDMFIKFHEPVEVCAKKHYKSLPNLKY